MSKLVYVFGVLAISAATPQVHAQDLQKFLSTPDGSMTAYFDGPQCAERIQLLFEGNSADAFKESVTPASRLMKNATRVMSRQCDQVERIVSKGVFEDRILYNGIAEAATEWDLVEIGVRSSGVAVAATSDEDEQAGFVSSDDFVSLADISDEVDQSSYCADPDADGTCIAAASFSATDAGMDIMARYLVDEDGVEAVVMYPGVDQDGLVCSATADVTVTVEGGNLSEDGRAEYAEQLRERLVSGGESTCSGFQKIDDTLTLANFDDQGRKLGDPLELEENEGDITLRLEE